MITEKKLPINIKSVICTNKQDYGNSPFKFIISYQVTSPAEEELKVKFTYINASSNSGTEEVLEKFALPLRKRGKFRINLNIRSISIKEELSQLFSSSSAITLSFQFEDQEFLRVGYYIFFDVQDRYDNEGIIENENFSISRIKRSVSKKPLITKFFLGG